MKKQAEQERPQDVSGSADNRPLPDQESTTVTPRRKHSLFHAPHSPPHNRRHHNALTRHFGPLRVNQIYCGSSSRKELAHHGQGRASSA